MASHGAKMGEPGEGRGRSTMYGSAESIDVTAHTYQHHSADAKGDATDQAAPGNHGNGEIW